MKKLILLLKMLLLFAFANSQTPIKKVAGRILDQNQIPVSNASIAVKNKNIKTLSDENGFFSINLVQSHDTLLVDYLDFQPVDVVVKDGNTITITPFPALVPQIEAAAASFSNVMLSMSLGFILLISPS